MSWLLVVYNIEYAYLDIIETRLGYPTGESLLSWQGDEQQGLVCQEGQLGELREHGGRERERSQDRTRCGSDADTYIL